VSLAERDRKAAEPLIRCVVTGPPEAGKTTLIAEFLRESENTLAEEVVFEPTHAGIDRDPFVFQHLRHQGRQIAVIEAQTFATLTSSCLVCDIAAVVVDARASLSVARYYFNLISLLGISRVMLAVSKLDLVDDRERTLRRIQDDFRVEVLRLGLVEPPCLPVVSRQHSDQVSDGIAPEGGGLLDCLTRIADSHPPAAAQDPSPVESNANRFEATIGWTSEQPLLRGRTYSMRIDGRSVSATVAPLKYAIDLDTLERVPATTLGCGSVGVCQLELEAPVTFAPSRRSPSRQSFALLDLSDRTVGVGLLRFALRRSENLRWQALNIDKSARAEIKGQKPCVIWFTGLSGAGKSTIANLVETELHARGRHTYLLDGDNVRHGLSKDLGFTDVDRVENIRRVAEVARLMVDAGLIVLVSFISPFRAERQMARELVPSGDFIEVFVDASIEVAEARDPKGLYKKARSGQLKNFTGVDSPYEPPEHPELRLDTTRVSAADSAGEVLAYLHRHQDTLS